MADVNGIKQTPFGEAACPTPDAQSGDQGIGGARFAMEGENGITCSPWDTKPVPTPGNVDGGSVPFGDTSKFSTLDGSTHVDENLGSSVATYKNTVDKR